MTAFLLGVCSLRKFSARKNDVFLAIVAVRVEIIEKSTLNARFVTFILGIIDFLFMKTEFLS